MGSIAGSTNSVSRGDKIWQPEEQPSKEPGARSREFTGLGTLLGMAPFVL